MKLALCLPSLTGGGGERAMLTLAGAFAEAGDAVDLLLMRRQGALETALPPGVAVVDLRASRMLAAVPALAAQLRRRRPDAVLATLFQANVAAMLAARASRPAPPVIITVETVLSAARADVAPTWPLQLAYHLLPRLWPLAARVIAVSNAVRRDLIEQFRAPPDQVEVIYNPVIPHDLAARAAQPPAHPWLAAKAMPTLVAAGRLHACKGFDTLIRAVALLRPRRAVRLVIAGEGEERATLEALAASLALGAHVALPGFVANPFALYRAADVFVSASHYEGFGNVIAEALACGTPVVATAGAGGPEEILGGGRFGRLVPAGDPAALADAIAACLDAPPPRADADWLRPFTVAHAAAAYRRLCASVLS